MFHNEERGQDLNRGGGGFSRSIIQNDRPCLNPTSCRKLMQGSAINHLNAVRLQKTNEIYRQGQSAVSDTALPLSLSLRVRQQEDRAGAIREARG